MLVALDRVVPGGMLLYTAEKFRNVFRVPRVAFEKLHNDLMVLAPEVWETRCDAVGREYIRSEVKLLACLCFMDSGSSLRQIDDQSQMGPETPRFYLLRFLKDVHDLYDGKFLNCRPTSVERGVITEVYEETGFPACLG